QTGTQEDHSKRGLNEVLALECLKGNEPWCRKGCRNTKARRTDPMSLKSTAKSPQGATLAEPLADPHRLADVFLQSERLQGRELRYWRSQFWRWSGHRYAVVDSDDLRAELTRTIKTRFNCDRKLIQSHGEQPRLDGRVTRNLVANVLQALTSRTLVPADIEQP